MSAYGGTRYGRETRRRQLRVLPYVGMPVLPLGTAAVVVLALQK